MIYLLREELQQFRLRLYLAKLLTLLFPPFVMNRLRTQVLRFAGIHIGKGSIFFGIPTLVGGLDLSTLQIGENAILSIELYFDLAAPIKIGNSANIGPQTMLITGTHKIGPAENRLGELIPLPIHIGDGVWIGARATILPGVTVGSGAVIAAGALVNRDVAPNTLVAGVPAKVIRELPDA
ncbi:MAG: hypothetical protein MUO62_14610 [Anaerolineales bacterium]|nr:hypothetical protein [Anaerolineales bacterium]